MLITTLYIVFHPIEWGVLNINQAIQSAANCVYRITAILRTETPLFTFISFFFLRRPRTQKID